LESNVLTSIGASSLAGLTSVATLNLHSNAITSIAVGAFSGLTSLRVVSVSSVGKK